MRLCGLFGYLLRITLKNLTRKQQSRFLQLPPELLYDIWDELPLPEKIQLSQVCGILWYTFHSRCLSAYRQATSGERLNCLVVLGDKLPDHRFCAYCLALHPINPKDLPSLYGYKYLKSCPAPEPACNRHNLAPFYTLAFQHVQLAMKYTHLKNCHQNYRASIMQKFTRSWAHIYSMRLQFIAEPRIVQGKFLLMATLVFHQTSESALLSSLSKAPFCFCAHVGAMGMRRLPENHLLNAVLRASQKADDQHDSACEIHSCSQCPTEFTIVFTQGKATFTVWQDLGTCASPEDPYWKSHIWSISNSIFDGPFSPYRHGSIREMYYNGNPC